MADEYQLRKDIDKIYFSIYDVENDKINVYTKDEIEDLLDKNYFDQSEVLTLIDESGGGGGSVIGTGSFSINNNGHLIVELPNAVDNPYFINSNGHLIYDTSNTHNGS